MQIYYAKSIFVIRSEIRQGLCDFQHPVNREQKKYINISQRREVTAMPNIKNKRLYGELVCETSRKKVLTNKVGYNQKDINRSLLSL